MVPFVSVRRDNYPKLAGLGCARVAFSFHPRIYAHARVHVCTQYVIIPWYF